MRYLFWTALVFTIVGSFIINGCSSSQKVAKEGYKPLPDSLGSRDFANKWERINKLKSKGKPQSALSIAQNIQKKAAKHQNPVQQIKAVHTVHELRFEFAENAVLKNIKGLRQSLSDSYFPAEPILQSILAKQFDYYYQFNRFDIRNRSTTKKTDKDIKKWSPKVFQDSASHYFKASLEPTDELRQFHKASFEDVLRGDTAYRHLRPSLFDLLSYRALHYFQNSDLAKNHASQQLVLDDSSYYSPAEAFRRLDLPDNRSKAPNYQSLRIYQQLIKGHSEDSNIASFIHADLERLQFIHQNTSRISNKNRHYFEALQRIINYRPDNPAKADAFYHQAKLAKQGFQPSLYPDIPAKRIALQICDLAEKQYPGTIGSQNCQALANRIKRVNFSTTLEKTYLPREPNKFLLNYRNLDSIFYRIVPLSKQAFLNLKNKRGNNLLKSLKKRDPIFNIRKDLELPLDHEQHQTEPGIPGLETGQYAILLANNGSYDPKVDQLAAHFFQVTSLSMIKTNQSSKAGDFFISNSKTGEPEAGVEVKLYQRDNQNREELSVIGKKQTDDHGHFSTSGMDRQVYFEIINRNDTFFTEQASYITEPRNRNDSHTQAHIFTDRSIYRPGQTVHFKSILINSKNNGQQNNPETDASVKVELVDANNQTVEKQTFETNDYGSFSGQFTLPDEGLNGYYRLRTSYGTQTFSVEEYKRPNFEINLSDIKSAYQLNEEVTLTGKAKTYSGVALEDAKVQYKVKRKVRFPFWGWWRPEPSTNEKMIAKGMTRTDSDGKFRLSFRTKPDRTVNKQRNPVFRYEVTVMVTDMTGETHEADKLVKAGYKAIYPEIKVSKWVKQANGLRIKPVIQNINGDTLNRQGQLVITKLKAPSSLYRNQLWSSPDLPLEDKKEYKAKYPFDPYKAEHQPVNWDDKEVVFNNILKANESIRLSPNQINGLTPGYYRARLVARNDNNSANTQQIFRVYKADAESAAIQKFSYFIPVNKRAEPGEEASFIWGSADDEAHATLHIEQKGKILEKRHLTVNDGQSRINIPIKESHRGNIQVHLFSVNENRIYTHQETIKVPWSNKILSTSFKTFRNTIKPGKEEKWTLNIQNPDGSPANAELLASMYDASLDAIKPHRWAFNLYPTFRPQLSYSPLTSFSASGSAFLRRLGPSNQLDAFKDRSFEQLMDDNYFRQRLRYPSQMATHGKEAVYNIAKTEESPEKKTQSEEDTKKEDSEEEKPQMRKNLDETAFFFPQAKTDANGNVTLEFENPEALTSWKAMFLAHDKGLANTYETHKVVTQKALMVEPNVPRFLREGDRIEFSAKIANMADQPTQGPAKLTILKAQNREPLKQVILGDAEKTFNLNQGQSTTINWQLKAPETVKGLIYQVEATSQNHTDGQEGLIPVLPANKLVTESLPLWVKGGNKRQFSFDRMAEEQSSTLENKKVVIEMATNPAWYAIQALPDLMEPEYESSEEVFNAYYSNSIASHIMQSKPEIESVFQSWQEDSTALQSNLQKNQGLKTVNTGSTPWLENAQNEKDRKARLAQYFNKDKTQPRIRKSLRKLKKWQLRSGAWPWFNGMNDSRNITQTIVSGIGHLDKLGIQQGKELKQTQMTKKALSYLDNEMVDDWQKIKSKADSPGSNHLSAINVQYLYARSFFKKQPVNNEKAFDYWLSQAKSHWLSRSLFEQAMLALALNRFGEKDKAKAILASLKDKALTDKELGMYWRDNQNGYQWYRSPIETQATLIEAFSEINKDAEAVRSMKVWLLKQKQVQSWPTTKATAKACYALLMKGADWLSGTDDLSIKLNDKEMAIPEDKEAGTGYFRKTWQKGNIDPSDFKLIEVQKAGDGIAWGALHWQYFEQLNKISAYETPLKVEKKLYKQVTSEAGKTLARVKKGDSLKPGDYITVRLALKTDRTMEFIHLQDMRAPALEPLEQNSGYRYQDGLGYYRSIKDATINFFFDRLPKGTHVFEYNLVVSQSGTFQNGTGTVQSMYAPEFNSHSDGRMLKIK